MAKERIKFTVWRDRWLRGGGDDDGALLRDGSRCCLGFLGQALGIPDDEMNQEACPSDVLDPRWPEFLLNRVVVSGDAQGSLVRQVRDSDVGNRLMAINDADEVTQISVQSESERERKIKELLAEHGVDVEFKDGVGP